MTDIHHDAAAILTGQAHDRDAEIALFKSRLGAIEWWITDIRQLNDPNASRIAAAMEACLLTDMPSVPCWDSKALDALKDLDRWVETLKGSTDPNVRRVAMAMDGIIEEAR